MICDVCLTEQRPFKIVAYGVKVCIFCWLKGWVNVVQKRLRKG